MQMLPLLRTITQNVASALPRILSTQCEGVLKRSMHCLVAKPVLDLTTERLSPSSATRTSLLASALPLYTPVCGLKQRGKLELRCRSCFFVARFGRLYVLCKKHPRHKQTQMMKRTYKTWILTHATQHRKRPW